MAIAKLMHYRVLNAYRKFKNLRDDRRYRGNKVHCPICDSHYSAFGSHGRFTRENIKCHRCGSLERHRALWLFLERKQWLAEGESRLKLLHVAPERSFFNHFRNHQGIAYYPCDLDPGFYAARGMKGLIEVDITDIPFDDNTFDIILCNHVLEHIPDDRKAMSELYRVLKPGGKAICEVPMRRKQKTTYEDPSIVTPEARLKHFGQENHVRWYGQDYADRLRSVGFEVVADRFFESFSEEEVEKYRIHCNRALHTCFKS